MRISKIEIKKYGPLSLKTSIEPSDFNLFWGLNEKGKTLAIEAILANLPVVTPNERVSWPSVFRSAEGNDVIVEIQEGGKIYGLRIGELMKLQLTRPEIFNLFFILNSNVPYDFEQKRDKELFQRVLDRMSSTYIDVLQEVKKRILEMNKLTDKLELKSTASDDYLGERYRSAKELIGSIDALFNRIETEKYQEIEFRIAEIKKELESISSREGLVKSMRDARIQEKSTELMEMYYDYKNRADMFKPYTDEALESFRNLHKELEKVTENIGNLRDREIKDLDRQISEFTGKLAEASKVKSDIQRVDVTERLLKEKILQRKLGKPKYENDLRKKKQMNILYLLFLLCFALSLGITFFLKITYLFVLPVIFAIASMAFVYLYAATKQSIKDFEALEREVKDRARSVGLKSEEIDEMEIELDNIRKELLERDREFERLKAEKETIEKQKKVKEEELKRLEERKIELETRISAESERMRVEDLVDFENKVKERKNLENKKREFFKELEGLWHNVILEYEDEFDFLAKVQDQLKKMRVAKVEGVEVEYNPEELEGIEEKKKLLAKEKEELEEKIQNLHREYGKIQSAAEDVLKEGITLETVSDLIECRAKLEQFVKELDERKKLSKFLVDAIDGEITSNQARFNELFSDLTKTSDFFKFITGGRYKAVKYDEVSNSILVEDTKGNVLDIFKLSGGTIDQLFFAIRIGLGMRILGGEKGFFVFDDPFVKSDSNRLKRELDLLVRISGEGWQVFYFSCKEEVRNYLMKNYSEKIKFVDLNEQSVLSYEI